MTAREALPRHWDAIGIGTSPLMLLHAATLARSGARVLLVDRGAAPGGSWRSATLFGRENVELGVHLIENRPRVVEILRGATQVRFRQDPPALNYGLVGSRRIHFGASRALLHGLVATKALLGRDTAKARRMGQSAWRALRLMRQPFFYPEGGMQSVIAALLAQIRAAGGDALFGSEVLDVAPGPAGARLRLADRVLDAGCVIFSSRAHAPVTARGAPELDLERSRVRSAVLHFAGRWRRPTGYVEAIGDPIVRRVRDVGRIARPPQRHPEERAEGLATIQTRTGGPVDDALLAGWLADQLKRLGLIEADARPLGAIRHDVELSTATDASLRRLAASAPWITTMPSTDLAEELMNAALAGRAPPASRTLLARDAPLREQALRITGRFGVG